MPTPTTPTVVKLLRGNPGKQRLPVNEPMPRSEATCPSPPSFLARYAVEEWEHTAPQLHALGLLTVLDGAMFAVYCSAYAQWRSAEELLAEAAAADRKNHGLLIERDGRLIANPQTGIARRAAELMLRIANEFGMTPAARSRINAGVNPRPPGKFDGLLA
jgi:P27 family predicted phage terminase small subunit